MQRACCIIEFGGGAGGPLHIAPVDGYARGSGRSQVWAGACHMRAACVGSGKSRVSCLSWQLHARGVTDAVPVR